MWSHLLVALAPLAFDPAGSLHITSFTIALEYAK
jgi:hypothetical protein